MSSTTRIRIAASVAACLTLAACRDAALAPAPDAPRAAAHAAHDLPLAAGPEETVGDAESVELRFEEVAGALAPRLWLDGRWAATSGAIADVIARDREIVAVTARFHAAAGRELRMRFATASGGWEPWGAWTGGRVERRIAAPAPGQELRVDFEAESRADGATSGKPTMAVHGYIKIKKLNSGG